MISDRLRTLVLNADGIPLTTIGWKRAITLVMTNTVVQIDFYNNHKAKDGKGRQHPIPSVIMIKKFIRTDYRHASFSRKNVLTRDHLTCQYCGERKGPKELTFDHVVPRCQWRSQQSPTTWENIVTCCFPCNRKKGGMSCKEAKMFPINPPARPKYGEMFLGICPWRDRIPEEWTPYLSHLPLYMKGHDNHEQQISLREER